MQTVKNNIMKKINEQNAASDVQTSSSVIDHRQVHAVLRINGPQGVVTQGQVRVTLRRHAFLFGCNAFGWNKTNRLRQLPVETASADGEQLESDIQRLKKRVRGHGQDFDLVERGDDRLYTSRFTALFNMAVLPVYEAAVQPEPDTMRLHRVGQLAAWARRHGLAIKGHPLIFHHRGWVEQWLNQLDEADYWSMTEQRIDQLLNCFGADFDFWDFINEPLMHCPPAPSSLEAVCRAYHIARQRTRCQGLTLNFNRGEATGPNQCDKTYQMIDQLLERGIRPDVLGVQAHLGRITPENWDDFQAGLSRLQSYCIPLHITETTFGSGNDMPLEQSEQKQADDLETFYTYVFSMPMVKAIIWWDLSDRHSFCKIGGLLRQDLSPKPAFDVMRRLIDEQWHTDLTLPVENGMARFNGFAGTYDAQIELPNGSSFYRCFDLVLDQSKPIDL